MGAPDFLTRVMDYICKSELIIWDAHIDIEYVRNSIALLYKIIDIYCLRTQLHLSRREA